MKPCEMILASQSPRRAEVLRRMGYRFRIRKPKIHEGCEIADPVSHVLALSHLKAEAVRLRYPKALVVGADTVVFHHNRILGKPGDAKEAAAILTALSGKTHQVFTGFVILHPDGRRVSDWVSTEVTFRVLEAWEIARYVATEEPYDKAGGYGIQGRAGLFVTRIQGCYYNVVGFPVSRFHTCLVGLIGPEGVQGLMEGRRCFSIREKNQPFFNPDARRNP